MTYRVIKLEIVLTDMYVNFGKVQRMKWLLDDITEKIKR